jgi:hypothetical protein
VVNECGCMGKVGLQYTIAKLCDSCVPHGQRDGHKVHASWAVVKDEVPVRSKHL